MKTPPMRNLSFVIAFALAQISLASAQDKSIVVASTTSTQDSGLYGFILPLFKQRAGHGCHAQRSSSQRSLCDV